MQIQVSTDNHIEGHERLASYVTGVVEQTLGHFSDRITRVEVHLADENGEKGGMADKRCTMEARLEHRHPTAVTHHAASLDEAINGAAHKLKHLIEHAVGRLTHR
jgi:hypothetical protein